jgi:alcohol dehydrogenase, propanol-preferring
VIVDSNIFLFSAILCAGVTAYKALKECEARAGQFICIIGAAGGLGHLAVQYAKAMGLRVIAIDLGQDSSSLCLGLGAEGFIDGNQSTEVIVQEIMAKTGRGCHGVVVIAPHSAAYPLAVAICRPRGTISCVSLPKDFVEFDMLSIVLHRITLRGSIVGTREDMREALDFVERGLVTCMVTKVPFENVNDALRKLHMQEVRGRIVLEF